MTDESTRPFLIQSQPDGSFRLTVRDVRYNSQGYPIVTGTMQDEVFATSAAAKNQLICCVSPARSGRAFSCNGVAGHRSAQAPWPSAAG